MKYVVQHIQIRCPVKGNRIHAKVTEIAEQIGFDSSETGFRRGKAVCFDAVGQVFCP